MSTGQLDGPASAAGGRLKVTCWRGSGALQGSSVGWFWGLCSESRLCFCRRSLCGSVSTAWWQLRSQQRSVWVCQLESGPTSWWCCLLSAQVSKWLLNAIRVTSHVSNETHCPVHSRKCWLQCLWTCLRQLWNHILTSLRLWWPSCLWIMFRDIVFNHQQIQRPETWSTSRSTSSMAQRVFLCVSARGRHFLLFLFVSVLLSGPIANIFENTERAAASLMCGAELAANQTQELMQRATTPLSCKTCPQSPAEQPAAITNYTLMCVSVCVCVCVCSCVGQNQRNQQQRIFSHRKSHQLHPRSDWRRATHWWVTSHELTQMLSSSLLWIPDVCSVLVCGLMGNEVWEKVAKNIWNIKYDKYIRAKQPSSLNIWSESPWV